MNSRRIASGAGLIAVAFLIAFLLWPLAVIALVTLTMATILVRGRLQ